MADFTQQKLSSCPMCTDDHEYAEQWADIWAWVHQGLANKTTYEWNSDELDKCHIHQAIWKYLNVVVPEDLNPRFIRRGDDHLMYKDKVLLQFHNAVYIPLAVYLFEKLNKE